MPAGGNQYRIDSHKLMFHPQRLAQWLSGENIYPIYVEISPSGACNHRCTFCALDYMGYKPVFLDTAILQKRLTEMGALGVKSVMFGGEGEPLLHRDIVGIAHHAEAAGIDVAFTTNAVLLDEEKFRRLGQSTSWLKISINAGTPGTYAAIHRTREDDFQRVIANMRRAVKIRGQEGHSCTLGAQMLLLPENVHEVEELARICCDVGLDYLVVKPYSQHLMSLTRTYEGFEYSDFESLAAQLSKFDRPGFSVIMRHKAMAKSSRESRGYARCLALPFWSYVDSTGNIWGCSTYLGDDRFLYGNITEESFAHIWTGERRRRSLEMVRDTLNPDCCRINCRMDEINRYLWDLTHPGPHVNFI